jgi:hypothetical protein
MQVSKQVLGEPNEQVKDKGGGFQHYCFQKIELYSLT